MVGTVPVTQGQGRCRESGVRSNAEFSRSATVQLTTLSPDQPVGHRIEARS
jgi:hypothetical protein